MGGSYSTATTQLAATMLIGALGVFAFLGAESEAQAQVNLGAEGGIMIRHSSPALNPGPVVGAHLDWKALPLLSVGAYYLYSNLNVDSLPSSAQNAEFNAWGGRIKLELPVPGADWHPYGYAGLGRVSVSYPSQQMPDLGNGAPPVTRNRNGWFLETPVGVGLAYRFAKIFEASVEGAVRPSFAFNGSAYDSSSAYDKTSMGYTGMLGLALVL